jgi:hypothetical protein
MATLNVANLNHSGTLSVNNLRHSDGVTKHTDVTYDTKVGSTLLAGISWHSTYDLTTQTIADLSGYVDSNTYAVDITHYYSHNGSTNHGYLAGYLFQQGKTYSQDGSWFLHYHYDWYYNVMTEQHTVKWDPAGNTNLQLYVATAYNTSTSNTHGFYLAGVHKKTA